MSKKKIRIIRIIMLLCIIAAGKYIIADLFNFGNPRHVVYGYHSSKKHFDPQGAADYTDYCKYYYDSKKDSEFKKRYEKVSDQEIEILSGYFDDFKGWMASSERSEEYDFNTDRIKNGDYYYIETKEGEKIGGSYYGKYDNYSVYYYDTKSHTLYYIHNNI